MEREREDKRERVSFGKEPKESVKVPFKELTIVRGKGKRLFLA